MSKRTNASERRIQLISIMGEIHQKARSQTDFTAAIVAKAAGISTVYLYRLVRPEFQALRAQLTGPRLSRDEVLRMLRLENAELRRQLREAQIKLRKTAVEELDNAIILLERYEKENNQLRQQVKLLQRRLEEGGHIIVPQSLLEPARPHHTVLTSADTSVESQ